MGTRCGGWIFALCFSLVSGFAQQHEPAVQSEPQASVPLGVADRLMTLDVVVADKSGRPLPDLQQQDFTLLDNKQPQKIVSFHAVEGGTATADPPVEVILLVDEVNTTISKVAFDLEEIEKFLRRNGGKLARPVSTVIFSDSGIMIGDTSSRDGNAVIADLKQKKTGLRTIGRAQGFYGAGERLQLSINSLEQLADYEAPRPGRKLVVWISPGWPLLSGPEVMLSSKQQQTLLNSIVAVSDRLRKARISLYDVDPLGTEDAEGFRTFRIQAVLKTSEESRTGAVWKPGASGSCVSEWRPGSQLK